MRPRRGALVGGVAAATTIVIAAACSTTERTPASPYDASIEAADASEAGDAGDARPPADARADVEADAIADVAIDANRYPTACLRDANGAGDPAGGAGEPPGGGSFVLVAHSLFGFSSTQGTCGWRYGYHVVGQADFVELAVWNPNVATWFVQPGDPPPWTRISRDTTHPATVPVEHWAIRRWVSDVEGPIAIALRANKVYAGGNGVVVRVAVDGATVYSMPLATWDTNPRDVVASGRVSVGSTVDLVLEPFDGDEGWDLTRTEMRVWR